MKMEHRIAYLRPAQVLEQLRQSPVVYLPVGPLEWHGPHLPLGTDPLNAEQTALDVCARTGGLVWPTLFWGTERERSPEVLKNLGFDPDEYIVGMDFPANTLPSAYCQEEIFGVLMREALREIRLMGAQIAVVVNGHGAVNHKAVLQRLASELNQDGSFYVYVRIAFPVQEGLAGSVGHAGGDETSLLQHIHPDTVNLSVLPPREQPLYYQDFAIVDGPGFDGRGRPDKRVEDDPRTASSPARGKTLLDQTVTELVTEVSALLAALPGKERAL
jgi:creatinine amidohydrolase